MFLRVRTNVGVRILYDREGLRLYLQVDQRWVEDTVGLCGTFNGNTQDDFLYVSLPCDRKERETHGPLRVCIQRHCLTQTHTDTHTPSSLLFHT